MESTKTQEGTPLEKNSIDEQFELYLRLVHLDKRTMPPIQLKELRQCFYGAFGQFLFLLQDLSDKPEEEVHSVLKSLTNQVSHYFGKPKKP